MSAGHAYGQDAPTELCPYCGHPCTADFVDIGVGFQQCGPYHCDACAASEIGPYDEGRELTPDEKRTGWYAPGTEPGSSANVIGGKVVDHTQMTRAYRGEFVGNPLHDVPGEVEKWRANIRKHGSPPMTAPADTQGSTRIRLRAGLYDLGVDISDADAAGNSPPVAMVETSGTFTVADREAIAAQIAAAINNFDALCEALEPFAAIAGMIADWADDETGFRATLKVASVRRAAAALRAARGEG